MFRAHLAQAEGAVYTLCWSAESEQILFSSGKHLVIRPLTPSSKQTMWKAHDAPVLSAEWNAVNNLIVSGGEDCKCALARLPPQHAEEVRPSHRTRVQLREVPGP